MKRNIALFIAGVIAGTLLTGSVFAARPGEADDPLVSLSYVKTGVAFKQVPLADGEKLVIAPGEEIILLKGNLTIESVGEYYVTDLTKGKTLRNPKTAEAAHLLIFTGTSSITLTGKYNAELLVRGVVLD